MRAIVSLFSFYGRARRSHYGIFFAISVVAYFVAYVPFILWSIQRDPDKLQAQLRAMAKANPAVTPQMFDPILRIPHEYVLGGLIAAGVLLAILYIIWVALTVRRLHDMNVTGWLAIVAVIVALVPLVGYLLVVLVLSLWPGTKGANGYGPDPRQPDIVPDVFGRESVYPRS